MNLCFNAILKGIRVSIRALTDSKMEAVRMELTTPLILGILVLGAAGGNIGGALVKKTNLGLTGNSITGAIGGVMGAQILQSAISQTMMVSLLGSLAGGMLFMSLIGVIKRSWGQSKA